MTQKRTKEVLKKITKHAKDNGLTEKDIEDTMTKAKKMIKEEMSIPTQDIQPVEPKSEVIVLLTEKPTIINRLFGKLVGMKWITVIRQ